MSISSHLAYAENRVRELEAEVERLRAEVKMQEGYAAEVERLRVQNESLQFIASTEAMDNMRLRRIEEAARWIVGRLDRDAVGWRTGERGERLDALRAALEEKP